MEADEYLYKTELCSWQQKALETIHFVRNKAGRNGEFSGEKIEHYCELFACYFSRFVVQELNMRAV